MINLQLEQQISASCQHWFLFSMETLFCALKCLYLCVCVCAFVFVCVGGRVVKRGCQSSCKTDSHSLLLCNSLISLLSSDTHKYRCTQHADFTHDCIHTCTHAHINTHSSCCSLERLCSRHAVISGSSLLQLIVERTLHRLWCASVETSGSQPCQEPVWIPMSHEAVVSFVVPIWIIFRKVG